MRCLVLLAPFKSSDYDPITTSLVKDCIDILLTPITSIVNLSLSGGSFPSHFNCALVSPVLKKPILDKDNMNYIQSGFNLSFLSTVREKVAASRLNSQINSSNTSNHYQSACKKFISTESALLNIQSDILLSIDDGRIASLTLLDLSTAFDTIVHTIHLRRLDDCFNLPGKALALKRLYC